MLLITPVHISLLLILLILAFALARVASELKLWKADVQCCREGGFCPPSPGLWGVLMIKGFSILLGFIEVGPIKIIGKHRIPKKGTVVLVPLHVDPGDVAFVSFALGFEPFWYMIRSTEMHGWRAWMGAPTGALAICEETDAGRSAGFKASLEALATKGGPRFTVVFGQGELVQSERIVREGFKEGFYALARLGSKKLKEPVYVVPMVLHYKRDPRLQTLFQRLTLHLGFRHFRNLFGYRNYGGVGVIGRAFIVDSSAQTKVDDPRLLPKDSKAALDRFVARMKILQRIALETADENPATIAEIMGTERSKEKQDRLNS